MAVSAASRREINALFIVRFFVDFLLTLYLIAAPFCVVVRAVGSHRFAVVEKVVVFVVLALAEDGIPDVVEVFVRDGNRVSAVLAKLLRYIGNPPSCHWLNPFKLLARH